MKRFLSYGLGVIFLAGLVFTSTECGKRVTEKQLYDKADTYERDEQFAKAAEVYLSLSKRFPNSPKAPEALFKAAVMYANNLKKSNEAIQLHERLIKTYPKSEFAPQSLFLVGFIYANDVKNYSKAKKYYDEFLKKYPSHELATSVQWELKNMGKDINSVQFLKMEHDSVKTQSK
ncbi:tol-pal system protein YbgF [bacterium BMS3Abin05]|nr:tol-pal system protein YbgF [bacterium BMS3Abin05]GBE28897.1 tol-pal system protein YbgF [bacterium BMS3Bbin03]